MPLDAFTRLELLAVVSALFVLSLIVLPTLANTKPRSDRVTCANNLRLVGRAEHSWASDHHDQMPWWVNVSDGGTRGTNLQNDAWYNFGLMTNELGTPRILACPSDPGTRVTHDFSFLPDGFFHSGNKNNSVSYFIGLHAFLTADGNGTYNAGLFGGQPRLFLMAQGGDRHLQVDRSNISCSCGVSVAVEVYGGPSGQAKWTNAIHGLSGNILMSDGQVAQTSNARVLPTVSQQFNEGGINHFLMPH